VSKRERERGRLGTTVELSARTFLLGPRRSAAIHPTLLHNCYLAHGEGKGSKSRLLELHLSPRWICARSRVSRVGCKTQTTLASRINQERNKYRPRALASSDPERGIPLRSSRCIVAHRRRLITPRCIRSGVRFFRSPENGETGNGKRARGTRARRTSARRHR